MEFYRFDTHTIMSGLVVRYQAKGYDLQISASRDGVLIQGVCPYMTTHSDIIHTQEVLEVAYRQFVTLRKDSASLPYEYDPSCVYEYRRYAVFSHDEYELIESRKESNHDDPQVLPLRTR